MHTYHSRTIIADFSDKALRLSLPCLFGVTWFVFLWGLSLAALMSGIALGMLIWLCIRQYVKKATKKREVHLRCTIGGELALSRLLMEEDPQAVMQCFEWVKSKYRLSNPIHCSNRVLCNCGKNKELLMVLNFHPTQAISTQQIVDALRVLKTSGANKLLLCITAPLSKDVSSFVNEQSFPLHIVTRDELVELAGSFAPATDDDLRTLGSKKRIRRSPKQWLAVILDPARTGRYLRYGAGFSLFAFLTGSRYYLFPAVFCFCMYVGSKWHNRLLNGNTRWKG